MTAQEAQYFGQVEGVQARSEPVNKKTRSLSGEEEAQSTRAQWSQSLPKIGKLGKRGFTVAETQRVKIHALKEMTDMKSVCVAFLH